MRTSITWAVVLTAASASADDREATRLEGKSVTQPSRATAVSVTRSEEWAIYRTASIRVCTRNLNADYRQLARRLERMRAQLQSLWFGQATSTTWVPRLVVILHHSLAEYQRALGSGVGRSVGCATLKLDGRRIVRRRIDVRTDADNWQQDALPHELTHIVLADRFAGRRIPHWANEGMGVLAESATKQDQRRDALARASVRGAVYEISSLIRLSRFPTAGYRDAFYGQSAAVVAMLVRRASPERFVEFLARGLDDGYDRSLKEVYNIDGVAGLTRLWKQRQTRHHASRDHKRPERRATPHTPG